VLDGAVANLEFTVVRGLDERQVKVALDERS
jgi:hypothetical protein